MQRIFDRLVKASLCLSFLSCADLSLAAQGLVLPSPMKVIPVQKLDFEPNADNSCISVEGPEIINTETLSDVFTTCALTLFKPLLKFKDGTQTTDQTIQTLTECSNASINPKHFVLIGHGSPGSIATGNGANPQRGQNIGVTTTGAIDSLRSLKASDVLLFSCDTGVGSHGMQLLNKIAEGKFTTRARNSLVMCELDDAHGGAQKGLYIFSGAAQKWITAQSNKPITESDDGASVDFNSDSCFALKDNGDQQFKVVTSDDFKLKRQRGDISVFDMQSETALQQRVFSEFEILPPGTLAQDNFHQFLADDPELLNSIDFCQVLGPDLIPDKEIIGTFTLKIDGNIRHFYQLRGGLAQDAEHPEVYYPMKVNAVEHVHIRLKEKSAKMLLQLQQEKLLQKKARDKN